jgi:hypothetical protein
MGAAQTQSKTPSGTDAQPQRIRISFILPLLRVATVFAAAFLMAYPLLFAIVVSARLRTDFPWHIDFTRRFFEDQSVLPAHFLFHFSIAGISKAAGISLEHSATLLIASVLAASAAIIHRLYLENHSARAGEEWMRAALTFVALTATAIYLPFFNVIYLGQSGPTVWHNPTNMLLKPFALVAALYLEQIVFGRVAWHFAAILFTSIMIGLTAKPSFALALIPVLVALVVYMSLPARLRVLPEHWLEVDKRKTIVLATIFWLVCTLVLMQWYYIWKFLLPTNGIIFAPFALWATRTPSIPISIVLATAFPIVVTGLDVWYRVPLRGLLLAWALVASGMTIFILFAESGARFTHGNFGWGYQISLTVLFVFAIRSYFNHWQMHRTGSGFALATVLLISHALSGIYYVYQILFLNSYL